MCFLARCMATRVRVFASWLQQSFHWSRSVAHAIFDITRESMCAAVLEITADCCVDGRAAAPHTGCELSARRACRAGAYAVRTQHITGIFLLLLMFLLLLLLANLGRCVVL